MIGKTVSHYKVLEHLGGGGMGEVYKAEDTKLKRMVALKFLPHELTRDQEIKKRFIQEAQAASALQHNNICTIHEIDETDDGQMFICMDYYQGESLKRKIERSPIKIDETINIAIQCSKGLHKAHERGIIHRDIKSANIIITNEDEVRIVDFGLAIMSGQTRLTKEGTTLGTVAYMSPEQTRGEEIDQRSDIWSLGVVLYEMVTGQMPFKGDYDQAVVYSIVNDEPEPATSLRTRVPMELERIINKALSKGPDERYQHVDDMLTDLKKLKKELQTSEKIEPPKVMEEKYKKKLLKRLLIPIGLLIILVLGFLLLRPILFEGDLVPEPKPIAVISFENQTGDETYDYLEKAIPNLLITNLEQSKYLRLTTWERMHDLLKQLGKEDVEIIDKDLGYELCRMDGVDAIVLGSFTKVGNMFATDVKVLDVATKQILKSANSKGKGEDSILETQIDELSKEISRGIGISDCKFEITQQPIAEVTTTSMEAYNYFLRGREDYEKMYLDDAKKFFEKAVQLDSSFAIAYAWLAMVNDDLGDIDAMKRAVKKAKAFAHRATDKERLFIDLGYAVFIEKDPPKYFNIAKHMVKKYPKEKRIHLYLSIYYKNRLLFNEAIEESNKALELDPSYGEAINFLAYLYTDMGEYETAIKYLKKYVLVSPGDANPFDSMGDLYFQMGKFDEAIAKYKEALKVKPDFFQTFLKIGYVCALKENYTEAMKWIDQYIVKAPSSGIEVVGYVWKGLYHYWLGNLGLSFENLRTAAILAEEIGNEFWKARIDWMKGWIYYERGEIELGWKHFTSYYNLNLRIKSYPQYTPMFTAEYSFYMGLLDLKQGRIDSTKSRLADVKSSLLDIGSLGRDWITFYYDLLYAELLLAEDSLGKAIIVCKNASLFEISMNSLEMLAYNAPFTRDLLTRIYLKKGELDKAITAYEQLITFDLKSKDRFLIHPKYHYKLAKLYEEKGWSGKAIGQYERFLDIWKDADKDLPELIDAKTRYQSLRALK
jgi:serine/threonine protein kinase/Tfp pilus assembly protein PilF